MTTNPTNELADWLLRINALCAAKDAEIVRLHNEIARLNTEIGRLYTENNRLNVEVSEAYRLGQLAGQIDGVEGSPQ